MNLTKKDKDLIAQFPLSKHNFEYNDYLLDKLQWKTRDEELIYIQDMKNSHVRNTFKYLIREKDINNCLIRDWIEILGLELQKRSTSKDDYTMCYF